MKLVYPCIDYVFDTDEVVNTIIIENPSFLYHFLSDIQNQIGGNDGEAVVSSENKILPFSKNVELITSFVPFDLNQKVLLSKVNSKLEKMALDGLNYEKTMEILSQLEKYLFDLSFELKADINFSKISIGSVIKAAGSEFNNEYDNLAAKLIDYMELVREFDKNKLFVLFNLRSFLDQKDTEMFFETVIRQGYHVIIIENKEYEKVLHEKRFIVDYDLCEIM